METPSSPSSTPISGTIEDSESNGFKENSNESNASDSETLADGDDPSNGVSPEDQEGEHAIIEDDSINGGETTSDSNKPKIAGIEMAVTQKGRKLANTFNRPPIFELKRTLKVFLQDKPCIYDAPKLPKCRECRLQLADKHKIGKKRNHNILCRFFAFRKLKYTQGGNITTYGFCDPFDDPTEVSFYIL